MSTSQAMLHTVKSFSGRGGRGFFIGLRACAFQRRRGRASWLSTNALLFAPPNITLQIRQWNEFSRRSFESCHLCKYNIFSELALAETVVESSEQRIVRVVRIAVFHAGHKQP